MRLKLATIIGEFTVFMSYQPSFDDDTLLKLTECINNEALPYFQKRKSPSEIIDLIDEATLESKLFKSVTAGGGSAPRLQLSLKKREIEFSNF